MRGFTKEQLGACEEGQLFRDYTVSYKWLHSISQYQLVEGQLLQ